MVSLGSSTVAMIRVFSMMIVCSEGRASAGGQFSLTGHLNCSVDGVFEIVRVIRGRFVSIAEVDAIVARAHLAQGQPKMARDRFGFLKRHGFVGAPQRRCAANEPRYCCRFCNAAISLSCVP